MSSVDEILDAAFEHPRGLLGRVGGRVVATCDASTERTLTRLAGPSETDDVLILEPEGAVAVRAAAPAVRTVTTVASSATGPSTAELAADSADVVLSVNGMHRWADRAATFAEVARILRPQGKLLLSVHERWAGVATTELAALVRGAGFVDVQAWRWRGPFGVIAVQLRATSGKRDGDDPAQRDDRADDPSAGV